MNTANEIDDLIQEELRYNFFSNDSPKKNSKLVTTVQGALPPNHSNTNSTTNKKTVAATGTKTNHQNKSKEIVKSSNCVAESKVVEKKSS